MFRLAVHDRARGLRAWHLFLFSGILATGGYFLLPAILAQDIVKVLIGAFAVATFVTGIRLHRPRRPLPWYLLASGMLLVVAGDVALTLYDETLWIDNLHPPLIDAFYTAACTPIIAGLVLFGRGRGGCNRPSLIDPLILAISVGMFSWAYLTMPRAPGAAAPSSVEVLLSITDLLAYVAMIALLVRLLFTSRRRSPALYFLCVSVLVPFVAGMPHVQTTPGTFEAGNPFHAGLLFFYVFFGAAALHPSMVALCEPMPDPGTKLTWRRFVLLTGAMLTPPGMLVVQATLGQRIDIPIIAAGSVALFLLVAVRMAGMTREREILEGRLEHQAFHDGLTGLPNRTLFVDRLQQALARAERQKGKIAVLFVNLDDFKDINDSLGHEVGDRLLTAAADRLRACLRAADTVARLGGDEFVVLLQDLAHESHAIRLAGRLLDQLQEPLSLEGQEVVVTASIGIALNASTKDRADDLVRNADIAMYKAKSKGKGCHETFDLNMDARARDRLRLVGEMREALKQQEFRVYYQPLISLETGRISEVEALVRWEHPQRGLLPPNEFIPLAEETGLILPLGQWVLEEACRQVSLWHERHPDAPPLVLNVNLSARQFRHASLVEDVARALRGSALDPYALKLEITESVAIEDMESAACMLHALKRLGVQLAIDDFGTGNSALSYLKHLPIDTLKIDRSFVQGLGLNAEDAAIVNAVVAFAKALNLSVTGEGIETIDQLTRLEALSCDLGQGYYFSKPVPSDSMGTLLKASKHDRGARTQPNPSTSARRPREAAATRRPGLSRSSR